MLFIIAWIIAMGTSELLLWSYGYLNFISPVLYISLCIMFLYQRSKISKDKNLNFHEKKIKALKMGITFILSMLVMLAIAVNIHYLMLIYTGI